MEELKPAGLWTQIGLLVRKNLIIKKRQSKKQLFGEICSPILYLAILSFLMSRVTIVTYPRNVTEDRPTAVLNLAALANHQVRVVPDNEFSRKFTTLMNEKLQEQMSRIRVILPGLEFQFYKNVDTLNAAYRNDSNSFGIALILPSELGGNFNYSIRFNPMIDTTPGVNPKTATLDTCRSPNENPFGLESYVTCPVNKYYYSNLLGIEKLVDEAVLSLRNQDKAVEFEATVSNYPQDEFCQGIAPFLRAIVPMYAVIPLTMLVNSVMIFIVTEKESRVKDGLVMVGTSDLAYWISWLGVYSLIMLLLAVVYMIVFQSMQLIEGLDPLLLFTLVFLFGESAIAFAFVLTAFFQKPKTAGGFGLLIMNMSSLLFLVQTFVGGKSKTALIPFKLLSPLAFTTSLDEACELVCTGGLKFADLYPGGRGEASFYSVLFLLLDIILYLMLAIYLDKVIPNENGVRNHPLFFLQRRRAQGKSDAIELLQSAEEGDSSLGGSSESVEKVAEEIQNRPSIVISNVRKVFNSWFSKKQVEAVKGISMTVYEGQITAILGKNGAGKSTLVNILAGLLLPSEGETEILGFDPSHPRDMAKLRKKLGVCLQSDIHFESLSVEEHLRFYAKLRGVPADRIDKEVSTIMDELTLTEKRNVTAKALSGGQKRKLSVGIALIGDPKIILLDEPSAGLDPVSRRKLWALLQAKKEGKIILLTTHFMDEADTLADRIAIVHEGELKCIGSSLFLKSRFGVGYHLTLEMAKQDLDTSKIDSIIERYIPEALSTRQVISTEVKYALPQSEASKFPNILREVEELIDTTGTYRSYGIAMTSLEDVFLKISSSDLEVIERVHGEATNCNLAENCGPLKRNGLKIFWSTCLLRMKRLWRSPQQILTLFVLPNIFLVIGLILVGAQTPSTENPGLILSEPQTIYPNLDIAVHDSVNSSLASFLNKRKVNAFSYSGNFEDLLLVNPGKGTAAAISILSEQIDSGGKISVDAALRVNGTFLHAPGIAMQLLSSYIGSKISNLTSAFTYETFPSETRLTMASIYSVLLLGPALVVAFIGMVMDLVRDRENKIREHLKVNGLPFRTYFFSVFLVYGGIAVLTTMLLLVMIWVFPVSALANFYASGWLLALFSLYITAALFCSAALSYLFDKVETAQSVFSQIASTSNILFTFTILLVDNLVANRVTVRLVHFIAAALNVYYIPSGVLYYLNKVYQDQVKQTGSDSKLNFSSYAIVEIWGLGVILVLQIPLFWCLLIAADIWKNGGSVKDAAVTFWRRKYAMARTSSISESPENAQDDMDEDVRKEKDKVCEYMSGNPRFDGSKCVLAVRDIQKTFKMKKEYVPVVRDVSFMVEEAEIFGLLGHNGAGKTTLMKIITAEAAPTRGKVKLCGEYITSNFSDAFYELGFCPQHDALWENISIEEHLNYYGALKGVSATHLPNVIERIVKGLQIEEHLHKYTQKLSGGTKRKLSYGMSILGCPRIALLDEPSTGMDPHSKRFLWNTVLGTFKDERGAILTTHSMEEADMLCSRIAIMVKGQILCIGSPQHLKTKYGSGYTVEIKVKSDSDRTMDDSNLQLSRLSSPLHLMYQRRTSHDRHDGGAAAPALPSQFKFLTDYFAAPNLVECFGDRGVFSISKDDIQSVSEAFEVLESLKVKHVIQEYAFSQTSLEQVFLSFEKYNQEKDN